MTLAHKRIPKLLIHSLSLKLQISVHQDSTEQDETPNIQNIRNSVFTTFRDTFLSFCCNCRRVYQVSHTFSHSTLTVHGIVWYTHISTFIHSYTHISTFIHTHFYIHGYYTQLHMQSCTDAHIPTHTFMHSYMYTHFICILHTLIQTFMHSTLIHTFFAFPLDSTHVQLDVINRGTWPTGLKGLVYSTHYWFL